MNRNLHNNVIIKLLRFFFKVVLRIGVNDSGVFIGEIPSYMPPPTFVLDERIETTYTIHLRRLVVSPHLRPTLRRLYHRKLH